MPNGAATRPAGLGRGRRSTPTGPEETDALLVCPGAPPDAAARRLRGGGVPGGAAGRPGRSHLVLRAGARAGARSSPASSPPWRAGPRARRAAAARAALRRPSSRATAWPGWPRSRGPSARRAGGDPRRVPRHPRRARASPATRRRSSTRRSAAPAAMARRRSWARSSRRRCPGRTRTLVHGETGIIGVLVAWVPDAARARAGGRAGRAGRGGARWSAPARRCAPRPSRGCAAT